MKAEGQNPRNLILDWNVRDGAPRGSEWENINKSKVERRQCTARMRVLRGGGSHGGSSPNLRRTGTRGKSFIDRDRERCRDDITLFESS